MRQASKLYQLLSTLPSRFLQLCLESKLLTRRHDLPALLAVGSRRKRSDFLQSVQRSAIFTVAIRLQDLILQRENHVGDQPLRTLDSCKTDVIRSRVAVDKTVAEEEERIKDLRVVAAAKR
ncbi:MAG: hypothetical protein AAF961_07545, partial [Planctomycetota bacterium]